MEIQIEDIKIKNKLLINKCKMNFKQGLNVIEGSNGCGKTLLLKYIFSKSSENNISYVDQDANFLLPNSSVCENILLSKNKTKHKRLQNLLKELGIEYLSFLKTKTLSGGEKRLVVLLRGFLLKSNIVILDEPTNDLDTKYHSLVLKIMQFFARKKIVIVATHDQKNIGVANTIYQIVNHQLVLKKDDIFDEVTLKSFNFRLFDNDKYFVPHSIRINYFLILISVFLMLILVPSVMTIIRENSSEKSEFNILPDKQINLYTLHSQGANHIENVAYTVPISLAKSITKNDPFKTLIDYQKNKSKIDYIQYSEITNFSDCEMFKFYPTYVILDNKLINILTSLLLKDGFNPDVTDIITDDYFIRDNYSHIVFNKNIELDYENYKLYTYELINTRKAKIVGAIITLNKQYSFNDFLDSSYFNLLKEDNIIFNNQIKNDLLNIDKLKINFKYSVLIMISSFVLFLINFFFTFIFIYIDRRKILIFKNHNYQQNYITEIYKNKVTPKLTLYILIFSFILINVILTLHCKVLFSMFLASICFFLYSVFSFIMSQKIIESYISKIYSWRYRFL